MSVHNYIIVLDMSPESVVDAANKLGFDATPSATWTNCVHIRSRADATLHLSAICMGDGTDDTELRVCVVRRRLGVDAQPMRPNFAGLLKRRSLV